MKGIRLVNGHFDGFVEGATDHPRQQLLKRLPPGDWVSPKNGMSMTHDIYCLTSDGSKEPVYLCIEQAIERAAWLVSQKLKVAAET